MSYAWAITLLFGLYFAGSFVNFKSKGRIGTALLSLVVLLIGFNTKILPADLVPTAQLSGMYALLNLTILINVGSSFDIQKLKNDWRLVVSVLLGICGMAVMILGLGGVLFGFEFAKMSFPTLVGGTIATALMTEAASAKGLVEMAALVVLVQSVQGWFGIPLISYGVRRECARLLGEYRKTGVPVSANSKVTVKPEDPNQKKLSWIESVLPPVCRNMYFYMFLACLYGALANVIATYTSSLTGGIVGAALVGMVLGCFLTQVGLLPSEPLVKAGMLRFFMFVLVMTMYGNLANLSLTTLLHSIVPILGLVIFGAIGMLTCVIFLGRKLGYATGMCIAFGMGCYQGYPGNYQVASEVIDVFAENEEEKKYLQSEILTRVVEGSVVSVSITSVVLAGIFVSLI